MRKDETTQAACNTRELSKLKIQIDDYKKDFDRMAKEKEVDTKKILDLTNEITAINFASSAKDAEVKELRAYVETLENRIVEKDSSIKIQEKALKNKSKKIKQQDCKIETLESSISKLDSQHRSELNNKKNAWAQMTDLKADIERLKEVIAKIEKRNIWERIINVKIK